MEEPNANPLPVLTYAAPGVEPVRGVAVERFDEGVRVVVAPVSPWRAVPTFLLCSAALVGMSALVVRVIEESISRDPIGAVISVALGSTCIFALLTVTIGHCRGAFIPTEIEARRGSVLVVMPGTIRRSRRLFDRPWIAVEAPSVGLGLPLQPLGELKIVDSRKPPPLRLLHGKRLVALRAIAAEIRAVVDSEAGRAAGQGKRGLVVVG